MSAGAGYACGKNSYEKLGTARSGLFTSPKPPEPIVSFNSNVDYFGSSGLYFTCALRSGVPWCWGIDSAGQLGLSGTGNPRPYPNPVNGAF